MSASNVDTVFVVGAGFSRHAGLPLTGDFTDAILEARRFGRGPSRLLVEFLSIFVRQAFGHSSRAGARYWPDLEDIFTCVDLSANSGHYLGNAFAPADLRTVRRALLSRIVRMLDQRYSRGRKAKAREWRYLDDFFWSIGPAPVGFISMNWDTVIERKLALSGKELLHDYCCDALPATIPDLPDPDDFRSKRKFQKAVRENLAIRVAAAPVDRRRVEAAVPIVKIHGSANWLYCDNCRQLFWFHPDQSARLANQLVTPADLRRIADFLAKRGSHIKEAVDSLLGEPPVTCVRCEGIALSTRIATFSYRKALDFPMFQRSWLAAEEMLRSARRWVFIGYSLPPADYEFKYLLKRAELSRVTRPEFIVITGGSIEDRQRTYENYQRFFGRSIRRKAAFFEGGLSPDAVAACR